MAAETVSHFEKFYNLHGRYGCLKPCYKASLSCLGIRTLVPHKYIHYKKKVSNFLDVNGSNSES